MCMVHHSGTWIGQPAIINCLEASPPSISCREELKKHTTGMLTEGTVTVAQNFRHGDHQNRHAGCSSYRHGAHRFIWSNEQADVEMCAHNWASSAFIFG